MPGSDRDRFPWSRASFGERCHQLSHSNKMGRTEQSCLRARHELVESVMLIVLLILKLRIYTGNGQAFKYTFKICGQKFGHIKI